MKRKVTLSIIVIGLVSFLPSPLFSATIYVPGDSATIQAGINGAVDGDTVLVANGTYTGDGNRDIDFGGKSIVLKSANGPGVTIIDCEGSISEPHRGFYFHSGDDSESIVDGFTIQGGYSPFDSSFGEYVGGGVMCDSASSPTLTNCVITGNLASLGGGIFCLFSSATITNNSISGNGAYSGSGIYCFASNPAISGNDISANSANFGGGIYCDISNAAISNNTISGNLANFGGGIFCSGSIATIVNNTISGNSANSDGGGIYVSNSDPVITNTIVWANAAASGSEIHVISGSPVITYCDIPGGWEGEGNIDIYPLFVDQDNGNFETCSQSPCIDAGDPGMLDPDSTRADIGVFSPVHPECPVGNVWYVSIDGSDSTGDGSSGNPFGTIQHSINNSFYSDTVIVRNGVYAENISFNGKKGESILLASDFIISGDTLDIQNTIIDGSTGSTVVTFELCDSQAAIIGFTITGGSGLNGGGISCLHSSPAIGNNIISGNSAGVGSSGGGIHCENSDPSIINCTITENGASLGGGIYCGSSNPAVSNSTIRDNTAGFFGGGLYCISSNPDLSATTISGNTAVYYGGGIYCQESSPLIINNTIAYNSANFSGGGLYCENGSNPTVENSIIAFNAAAVAAVFCDVTSNPVLTCCDIYGNDGGDWVDCIADQADTNGNFSADPLFCYASGGLYNLDSASQCAANNNSCGVLIGSSAVGCISCCVGIRGNIDGDAADEINIADLVYFVDYSFNYPAGPEPPCFDEADVDATLEINIADIVYMLDYMFSSPAGPRPMDCP